MRRRSLLILLVLLCVFVLSGHTASAIRLFDEQDEVRIGRDVARRVESEHGLTRDPAMNYQVSRIGDSLVPFSSRPNLPYTFQVLANRDVNALAAPGGFIYVNSGLIEAVDDEHELAAVIAHEIAHVSNRHGMVQLERTIGLSLGISIVLRLVFKGDAQANIWEKIGEIGLNLVMQGYSRENEHDADLTGVRIMYDAGYDPYGMVRLLKRLEALQSFEPSRLEVLFRTHPPINERINKVEEYIKTELQTE